MFSSHGHSHDGGSCNHGHGGHGHSHGARSGGGLVGFGDDDDDKSKKMNPMMNPMMMAMMNAMKNEQNPNGPPGNPMMMAMMNQAQMNPQMMEMGKKMFEMRQQMMKEFMEKGGHSNPAALQELMAKAQQAQAAMMAEFKANNLTSEQNKSSDTKPDGFMFATPVPPPNMPGFDKPTNNNNASDLLGGDLNNSKLDDIINKRNLNKKAKEEQEAKVLDAIARKDFTELNAVKATQYGVLERLKELVESNQVDPNAPDAENVYLLHWAAINNRIDIAKYLISLGVNIDPVGGELETTPLNWAARSGHVNMCVLLMQHGANPTVYDVEGFSTIHLGTMFGHSNVVAYLLVKGIDVKINIFLIYFFFKYFLKYFKIKTDMPDKNGVTPLMYAAQRVHS